MYFMIDNYDSFVYNLSAYLMENGQDVIVRRADEVSVAEVEQLCPEGIIISPGPGHPADAKVSLNLLSHFQGKIPILGVCLGHQLIGYSYGALIQKGSRPMHGKVTHVTHNGTGLFSDIPTSFRVTRYHSLIVSQENLPENLKITAQSEEGIIMGVEHRTLPVYGVQFHPEAVLTEYGHELLANFHQICQKWKISEKTEVA